MAAEQISVTPPRWRIDAGRNALLLWLIPAALYYAFLLSAGAPGPFGPVQHGLTFNSMLLHLLHGRFDVDPAAVGDEGYLRDGVVYAYFGIFPALFRGLFLWLPNFAAIDFTRVACFAAVLAMASAKLMSVRLMWQQGRAQAPSLLLAAMTAAILVSGAQIEFLRPSIYQEVELWAGALSAVFVYLVLRGLCAEDGFSPRLLSALAAFAGLCLLTRVSNALGLYAAFGLIWLCIAWRAMRAGQSLAPLLLPAAVAIAFVAVTGWINFMRWGDPLVFADFSRALINAQYPGRMDRLQRFGAFNLARIGYGLSYYFAPVWVMRDVAGNFLWPGFEEGFGAACTELPPSSFFVSDPLLIGLCIYGIAAALRKGAGRRDVVAAAGLGLLVPVLLMLTALGMSYRYRMEFYPFIEFFAFLGFARLAAKPAGPAPNIVAITGGVGILTAHAVWLLYMLSPLGPTGRALESFGVVDFYTSLFD